MGHMTGYDFFSNHIAVYISTGQTLKIYFNSNSGKVYYRDKIGSPTGIKHTGVFLGVDARGRGYFVHNHYHVGKAHIVSEQEFSKGRPIYLYNEYCLNSWETVIKKALQHVLNGERYMPFSYNCQTVTNDSCNNQRKSEDAARIGGGIAAGVALFAIFALLAGGKD